MSDSQDFSEGILLGKETNYSFEYDASLLFPIKRQQGRSLINISSASLPFSGVDRWTAFELSYLCDSGLPKVAIAQFDFAAESENIVESKSFKLYLNSFNQTVVPNPQWLLSRLQEDLSKACKGDVLVKLFDVDDYPVKEPQAFVDLDAQSVKCNDYLPNASLLMLAADSAQGKFAFKSHLLRSLCPVTGQPDWASLYIQYEGVSICPESLLRYIVSFRNHQGFHEQCVEQIFCDLQKLLHCDSLSVYARYMRRGGLDINPLRIAKNNQSNLNEFLDIRTARQ